MDFTSVLRWCCVISFRYNIIGNLATNEQERVYNRSAVELASDTINTLQELINSLSPLYVSDEKFRSDFSEKELRTTQVRNRRIIRYILFEIERHISNNSYDFESGSYNLEHIMPESIQEGWDDIEDKEHDQFVYRLGNMTILNKSVNRDIGNADFSSKKEKYFESEFSITQRVANENSDWNPGRIAENQKWMARQATAIWRIAQLD